MVFQNRYLKCLFAICFVWQFSNSQAQESLEQLEEEAITRVVESISPSLVRFETIGGLSKVEEAAFTPGPGTGVVVSADGYVVSASFHFANQPSSILATLADGTKLAAEIVGRDPTRKIVLLKLDTDRELRIPNSVARRDISVGETVVAIGRVIDDVQPNVSTGIVSATERIWGKAVQTDAKISPANFGGPLVTLSGKVVGVLVPMSPDDDAELAGTEWYDSGIGFAVPWEDVVAKIESLKAGERVRAGLLGVSFQGADPNADPAKVGFCHPSSPAAKSDVRPGDELVEINGTQIVRQAQVKHAIGPLYAGDSVNVKLKRGSDVSSFTWELQGEFDPFIPHEIGVTLASESMKVRSIFKESPAANANLQSGDKILRFNGQDVDDPDSLRSLLVNWPSSKRILLSVLREGNVVDVTVEKQRPMSASLLNEEDVKSDGAAREIEFQVADSPNRCFALLPAEVDSACPLIVWLAKPGKFDTDQFSKRWSGVVGKHASGMLFLESTDAKRWRTDDMDFVVNAIATLGKRESIDQRRIVVGGEENAGTFASLIAFKQRELFSGLILKEATLASQLNAVQALPLRPLLVLVVDNTSDEELFERKVEKLSEGNIPYLPARNRSLKETLEMISRWPHSVDRM